MSTLSAKVKPILTGLSIRKTASEENCDENDNSLYHLRAVTSSVCSIN